MVKTIGLAVLLLTMAGAASAREQCRWSDHDRDDRGCQPVPVRAPEMNATSAVAGITLLLGGLAIVRARSAKKSTES